VEKQKVKMAPADIFLIAGNRESRRRGSDPLLARILTLIGLERPAVAYLGAASNDNRIFFMWISAMLKKAGAGSVRLAALASRHADLTAARHILHGADLIFISGGDVEVGMHILERTGFSALFRELHQAGKPFIGLSAGSIMLAQSWVHWADAADNATAEIFPCLGLAPLLCDTHAEKENWEELKVLLRLTRAIVGYGIPSGAALRISADGSLLALSKPVQRFSSKNGIIQKMPDLLIS
jgi:peptidase E